MLWVAVKMCKTQFVCFFGHYTSTILLLVPLSLSVPSSATHHTVQQMWAECCMCESQVLNCEVTLVILCKTLLDWLAACVCAWEQHDREESNLSSSFHPSFSISPPIVLVNHFIDTAILLMLFQPSTSLISCTNQSIVSPLTRLFIFLHFRQLQAFWSLCRARFEKLHKIIWIKITSKHFKINRAYFAANDLPDYIWTDLSNTSHLISRYSLKRVRS